MTKVYGFVAEFNPFHKGHQLFIEKIKQQYHPDVLIAVMSGNFVQRGDFAILDKWNRAQLAIENGVDLVVELPFAFALEPAQFFAQGAMKLLNQLEIDHLVFGTENQLDFLEMAQKIIASKSDFTQNYNQSSATNLTNYYHSLGIDVEKLPNQLLGINYATEIIKGDYDIQVATIKRLANDYSATKIREALKEKVSVSDLVPKLANEMLQDQKLVTWDKYFPYLKYQILSHTPQELGQVYQMVEGLEYKLKKEINSSSDFNQFIERIKSKRYTMARLRRLLMYTLINVKESDINDVYENPYLRILGFNRVGQEYLNSLKKNNAELITRVGKKEQVFLNLEIKVDRIFQLENKQEQNFGRIPYMKGVN